MLVPVVWSRAARRDEAAAFRVHYHPGGAPGLLDVVTPKGEVRVERGRALTPRGVVLAVVTAMPQEIDVSYSEHFVFAPGAPEVADGTRLLYHDLAGLRVAHEAKLLRDFSLAEFMTETHVADIEPRLEYALLERLAHTGAAAGAAPYRLEAVGDPHAELAVCWLRGELRDELRAVAAVTLCAPLAQAIRRLERLPDLGLPRTPLLEDTGPAA